MKIITALSTERLQRSEVMNDPPVSAGGTTKRQRLELVSWLKAILTRARETGGGKVLLSGLHETWRRGDLLSTLRQNPVIWTVLRYVLAVACVGAAFLLQIGMSTWVGGSLPTFILFYPAVVLAAFVGGWKPGLVATSLTLVVVDMWLVAPIGLFSASSPTDRLSLVLFAFNGGLITTVAELYHRQSRKATAYAREVAAGVERLRMAAMLEAVGQVVISTDLDQRITFWNRAAMRLFGWTPEEVLGRNLVEVTRPEAPPEMEAYFREKLLQGETFTHELALHRKDGTLVPLLTTNSPVLNESGEAVAVIGVGVDLTERKGMENTLRFLAQCGTSANGKGFFSDLAQYLAETLEMDFVCIDRLKKGNLQSQTLAMFDHGQFLDNISYTLKDTPCGAVVGQQVCVFPRDVRKLFPKDEVLQQMGAESYLGVTLWGSQGQPIGLIAVIGRQPLVDTRSGEAILQLVAVRAGAELERQQAEAALQENQERLALAASGTQIGMFDWDGDTGKVLSTEQYARLLGLTTVATAATTTALSQRYTYEQWAERVHPEDLPHVEEELRRCVVGREPGEAEFRVIWPDGSLHWLVGRGVVVPDTHGQYSRIVGIVMDITARREAQGAVEAALREKDVLLHEVHHRVKNNMQVLSSLVSLQAGSVSEPAALAAMTDVRDRVRSMALVHEKLYQSGKFAELDFATYAESLLEHLWQAHRSQDAVELKLALEPISVSLEKAVPCGLLLNELTINALKHAFQGRAHGTLKVSTRTLSEGKVSLCVTDDGVGLPDGFDWRQATTLGLRLVQILSRQVDGTMEARRPASGGTEFEIIFPGGAHR